MKYIIIVFSSLLLFSCKKELNVSNPNLPTVEGNVNSEAGIISLAMGGVYINGFKNGDDWLGDSYFSLPLGYAELLGDVVGAQASNQLISTMSIPEYYILEGAKKETGMSNTSLMRANNTRAQTGSGYNPTYYLWLNMYAMNNTCNQVLGLVDAIPFTGDATTKANTIRAWCYWWKAFAYAQIGSMYYAGLRTDSFGLTNNHYVIKDSIIAASNAYLEKAAGILQSGIGNADDYAKVLGALIPSFCQTGHGGVLTTDMWLRNINTLQARNLLVNKLSPFVNKDLNSTISASSVTAMTADDWNEVLTLTTNGIRATDYVFTGRSTQGSGFFTASGGTVSVLTTGVNTSTTFRLGERFIQHFHAGDQRLANNFDTLTRYKDDLSFGTRWSIIDGGKGATGVYVYGNTAIGAYEQYIAGSYEENALMLAEANLRLGNTDVGLGYVDAVRAYQGAGIGAVANAGLSAVDAMTELVMERRVALVFRGISFYDMRRWGWAYDIGEGGGSYGNNFLTNDGVLHRDVTINFDFMDYWDVPADESDLNPAGEGSVEIKNPNY